MIAYLALLAWALVLVVLAALIRAACLPAEPQHSKRLRGIGPAGVARITRPTRPLVTERY